MSLGKFDTVDLVAAVLLAVGLILFAWGSLLAPPVSANQLVLTHFGDWVPGLIVDGILLFVLNRVIRSNERRRVIRQVASLSNEFALDAVRRCREEGWLQGGLLANMHFAKARLASADLSDAMLAGVDLSFADLSGANLTNANLRGANLTGTNFTDADLRWADLSGASIKWSDLRNAEIDGAKLEGINADFASVDSRHTVIPEFENAIFGGFLSSEEINLVDVSFQQLIESGDEPIRRFYEKLFATAPQFRKLFSNDTDRQARKFLQSLKLIVNSLSSIERASPVLHGLGHRHQGYGVKPEDYDVVGAVLIETLQETLTEKFSDDAKTAWIAAYRMISTAMRSTVEV